jgi:hypothetical protein
MPQDFEQRRADYYDALGLPLDAETFIARLKRELGQELTALDRAMPRNPGVKILDKGGGWIRARSSLIGRLRALWIKNHSPSPTDRSWRAASRSPVRCAGPHAHCPLMPQGFAARDQADCPCVGAFFAKPGTGC